MVEDSAGTVIGEAMGPLAGVVLFQAAGLWFIPCYNVYGFGVYAQAYYATPSCTGQAYYPDVSWEPALECGQVSIPANGGSILYPDISRPATVTIESAGTLLPDGSI